jgi:hypothetical protein
MYIISYNYHNQRDTQMVLVSEDDLLAELHKLVKAGAVNTFVWEPQCSCDGGFILYPESEDVDICTSCKTGQMLAKKCAQEKQGYEDDEFPF